MIVREIKQDPTLIENFDWFNDYKDTRGWAVHSCPELVEKLDEGYDNWVKEHAKQNKKRYGKR